MPETMTVAEFRALGKRKAGKRRVRVEEEPAAAIIRRCGEMGLPVPVREHRFHPVRQWKFDLAWPAFSIAIEIEGSVFKQGRHTRGTGFLLDMEKYNAATALGWRVLRTTPDGARGKEKRGGDVIGLLKWMVDAELQRRELAGGRDIYAETEGGDRVLVGTEYPLRKYSL